MKKITIISLFLFQFFGYSALSSALYQREIICKSIDDGGLTMVTVNLDQKKMSYRNGNTEVTYSNYYEMDNLGKPLSNPGYPGADASDLLYTFTGVTGSKLGVLSIRPRLSLRSFVGTFTRSGHDTVAIIFVECPE